MNRDRTRKSTPLFRKSSPASAFFKAIPMSKILDFCSEIANTFESKCEEQEDTSNVIDAAFLKMEMTSTMMITNVVQDY